MKYMQLTLIESQSQNMVSWAPLDVTPEHNYDPNFFIPQIE